MHSGCASELDRPGLVQSAPPIDAEFYDGQVYGANEGEDRAGPVAADRVVKGADECDVPSIKKEEHEHGREAGVPYPPCAPHRLTPQTAGGEAEGGEGGADRPDFGGGQVGQGVSPDDRGERC